MKPFGVVAVGIAVVGLAASANALEPRQGAHLRALEKITGDATDLTVKVGETKDFGRIAITLRACWQAPPEDTPESEAFLEIRSRGAAQDKPLAELGPDKEKPKSASLGPDAPLFSGWMFASSPGLNALEHPVYDVWVISCTAASAPPPAGGSVEPPAAPASAPADAPVGVPLPDPSVPSNQ
ncbi:MAG: DUF2155 domain-containing protein [Alphaproteobacteria bacterium]|nr:DUF2155 domain-containing protein [Alphaproteobacteria bacterium]